MFFCHCFQIIPNLACLPKEETPEYTAQMRLQKAGDRFLLETQLEKYAVMNSADTITKA